MRAMRAALLALLMAGTAPAQIPSLEDALSGAVPPGLGMGDRARTLAERNVALLGGGPVDPAVYVLGPGDLLGLEIHGSFSLSAEGMVAADGTVSFPQLGTFSVADRTLAEARDEIERGARRMVRRGTPRLILKEMRAFKVYLGGAGTGEHVVRATAQTRVSEILTRVAVPDSASLRRIRIRHRDGTEETADLLGFLLAGETAGNPFLRDGDVLVVPPLGDRIGIAGAVGFPGEFDYAPGDELGRLLSWVGILPHADTRVVVQRFRTPTDWDTLTIPLPPVLSGEIEVPLAPGDRVLVPGRGSFRLPSTVTVEGAVRNPGPVAIRPGRSRVADAIRASGGELPDAVLDRVILERRVEPDTTGVRVPTAQTDPVALRLQETRRDFVVDLHGTGGPLLVAGDRIRVPRSSASVLVLGAVRRPGLYDHREGWSAGDYIGEAGGFGKHADKSGTRVRRGTAREMDLAANLDSLAPGDEVWVPERKGVSFWETVRNLSAVASTGLTLVFLVREITR